MRSSRSSGSERRGPAWRWSSRGTRRSSSRSGRACCAWSPRTSPRTRSATPGPGATFTLAVERDGDEVVLRGTDDGGGVAEEELPRLFERFFRADRARSSRGTGLGLAIVKHIVTQAGGTVEARGGLGAGLEVRCVFPAAEPPGGSPVLHKTFTTREPTVRLGRGETRCSVDRRRLH